MRANIRNVLLKCDKILSQRKDLGLIKFAVMYTILRKSKQKNLKFNNQEQFSKNISFFEGRELNRRKFDRKLIKN